MKKEASEDDLRDVVAKYLVECVKSVKDKKYALETCVSPENPFFYQMLLDVKPSAKVQMENDDYLLVQNGKVIRVKGKNICDEKEKALLGKRASAPVWKMPLEDYLKGSRVDYSILKFDPQMTFNFTDDDQAREIALRETARIHQLNELKGYDAGGDRIRHTPLRNKGQIREWFFEYSRILKRDRSPQEAKKIFDIEGLKREWLRLAQDILQELNQSKELTSLRVKPWGLRDLKLNFCLLDRKSNQSQMLFVRWSHCVIEYTHYLNGGHRAIRIPIDEFYSWAENELMKQQAVPELQEK